MAAFESCLKRLAEGAFICDQRYPEEYEALASSDNRDKADAWLRAAGYRLARLDENGAYFSAHAIVTAEMRSQLQAELLQVRGRLEPFVSLIETIRITQGRNARIYPGEFVYETEIGEAVRQSPLLERRLQEMRDLTGARITDSAIDRVRRMLGILVGAGYLVEVNASLKQYQFTGKLDYLYQLIAFVASNTPLMAEDGIVDQLDREGQRELAAQQTDASSAAPASQGSEAP